MRALFVQQDGSYLWRWSRTDGSATDSSPGSRPPRSGCITTCWRSRLLTSSHIAWSVLARGRAFEASKLQAAW